MAQFKTGHQIIQFEDSGTPGPAVIFNHSFGMNGAMFQPQLEAFAGTYRCVTWDERGHGGTLANGPFTFWDSAEDCLKLLDHLGIQKAIFVGTSQGGFIALRTALLAPQRVQALAILGSSAAEEDPARKIQYQQLHDAFVGPAGHQEPVLDMMATLCFGAGFDAEPWKSQWRQWPTEQFTLAFQTLVERDSVLARLHEIKAPTLVMHGSADGSFDPSHGEAIADGVGNGAGFVLVDNGAHFLNLTDPAPVNQALKRFLADNAPRATTAA
jgi:3-oxoadipate enol-lactonase